MTETIQTAMDRLMTISVEPQDYVAEDGLLYCGSCKTPKEAFFPNGKKLFGRDRHPAECRCRQATREKQEKEERARLHYEKVQRLKLQGFTDWAMQHWTFANDHGQNPQMQLAQRYVAHWPEMREKNVGLLLWGGVGTGKSFMAGCIANALMEQEVAVYMTNFARIMNELNSAFAGRNEVVDRLCRYPLLVIDDFGMERGTEYALEQIYNIIDSRYRSRKPLIVTTNLTLTELKNPQDMQSGSMSWVCRSPLEIRFGTTPKTKHFCPGKMSAAESISFCSRESTHQSLSWMQPVAMLCMNTQKP